MSENEEFIREFLEECEENLDQLDRDLVALEQDPHGAKRLESIFRTIHTIKGTSGFFGFSKLGALTHDGESLLGRLHDGELVLNQQIATSLLQLIDSVREILGNIRSSGAEGSADYQAVSADLIRLALSPGVDPAANDPSGGAEVVADESNSVEADPNTGQPDSEGHIAESNEADQAGASPVEMTEDLRTPTEAVVDAPPQSDVAPQPPVIDDVPADASEASHDSQPELPATTVEQPIAEKETPTVPSSPQSLAGSEGSIRVDVRLLDELVDLAGELVLARNRLNQLSDSLEDTALLKTIQRLSVVTSELQAGVMQTRMQPISTIWAKFPRIIRDLSVACGKEIALHQEGEDTELDRSLLEAIRDPLTHLIRNAVDHGIESSEIRQAQGKPPQGQIMLRAYHEGGQVNIEIRDDGSGIDVEQVKRRALKRGLITADQAAALSEQELVQIIFRPGFSTAKSVTDVSGRGVGMDVVRTNIERIGGTVSVHHDAGEGTAIRITIPLTLAIIPALIVAVGRHRFAIPQASLIELLNFDGKQLAERIEWVDDAPVCRLRGRLLPLVFLNQLLRLDPPSSQPSAALKIVVLQAEGCRFGLVVDQVTNTEEIVVKPLSRMMKSISAYSGATIMGDGAVVLILDVVGLAHRAGMNVARDEVPSTQDAASDQETASVPFLLCEDDARHRLAIQLADVERLEEFPADRLEHAASMEVVQYGGEAMPLVRLAELLGWSSDRSPAAEVLRVVVHRRAGRNAGLVVPRIVDIVGGSHPIEQRAQEAGIVIGASVIDGRITDVIDVEAAFRVAGVRFAERVR